MAKLGHPGSQWPLAAAWPANRWQLALAVAGLCIASLGDGRAARADEFDDAVAAIEQTGGNAAGSAAAKAARDRLARSGPTVLPRLLRAMNTTNIVAANFYRSAWDEIVAREMAESSATANWPQSALAEFVDQTRNGGRPRRLALVLLGDDFRQSRLPAWLDDPEFRDEAVAWSLTQGDARKNANDLAGAQAAYRQAFEHGRDSDQVLQAVTRLQTVGIEVDPAAHLGFVTRWYLCGPFDAPEMTGFATGFPPEQGVDLAAQYATGDGKKFGWQVRATRDPLGQFNLIQDLAAVKEAVGYAYCEFEVPTPQDVQLRCSADDNLSVWLNGRKVLAREQWLNGTRLDRFIAPVTLAAGRNKLLVKICQGPQHVDPAVPNNWSFQLRMCGADGAGVKFQLVRPTKEEQP